MNDTPNIERLCKVADIIQEHPEHFHMQSWIGKREDNGDVHDLLPGVRVLTSLQEDLRALAGEADLLSCGTTACIAGWAVHLWSAEVDYAESIQENATRILGLDEEVADDLFMEHTHTFHGDADAAAAHLREMARAYESADA